MKINKSYKLEIYPDERQRNLFSQAFGTNRYVYNHLLSKCNDYYEEHKKPHPYKELKSYITEMKHEYDWMYNVPKSIHQNAYFDLVSAFKTFYRNVKAKKKVGKKNVYGFPQFKSLHYSKKSFKLDNDRFKMSNQYIVMSIFGKVKLSQYNYIPSASDTIKYMNATISYRGGKYFVSVSVEHITNDPINISSEVVGVDLGIKSLMVCSNGMTFNNPKTYRKHLVKLKRLQKEFNRRKSIKENNKTIASKRKRKTKDKLSKHHLRIANIRHDNVHKMTTSLVKTKPMAIVIENLNVKGMMKNRKLSQSLADSCFGMIAQTLQYKCNHYGIELVKADRFFPSSKLCNSCGSIKDILSLSERTYSCECGYTQDRDLNAAINLKEYYTQIPMADREFTLRESIGSCFN